MPDLEAIEARANAATPGPWGVGSDAIKGLHPHELVISKKYPVVEMAWGEQGARDAQFIAHARADVPELVTAYERALTLIRDLVDDDDCWYDHHGGCQAHGYLSLEPGQQCPHAEAKELLAQHGAPDA